MTQRRPSLDATVVAGLVSVLERARDLGFLGPGPTIEEQIDHSLAFARAVEADLGIEGPDRALDLGSGGGIPGLVLAAWWPRSQWVLLDANQRRTAALTDAVAELSMGSRVTVERARAEDAARDPRFRQAMGLVTSRSFGPPAVVAECAAGFLEVGGTLVVSEPRSAAEVDRWPADGLAKVGLEPLPHRLPGFRTFRQTTPAPAAVPRRVGLPAKRPLFS